MALTSLCLVIRGIPAPKGSVRAAGNRVIPSGSPQNAIAQADFSSAARAAAIDALRVADHAGQIAFVDQALAMRVLWRLPRPRAHFVEKGPRAGQVKPTAPLLHTVPPDNSKLIRALEDHFNKLVWDDDSRVAWTVAKKHYATPGDEGAVVEILALDRATGVPLRDLQNAQLSVAPFPGIAQVA